ncbi:MAG: phosphoenolpyruvate--protein phosphotransferase [Gammaproteobacteria bacterium]
MLNILRRIVQEINAAHDFGEALQILVQRVREAVETQACTVFLIDPHTKEFVLMATAGLNQEGVGKIRLKPGEGLIGLVADREEPINLEDAPSHPSFAYHPSAGEERFKAFLGVPIIHHRELYGVLFIQQEEKRRFGENEEAFLITISAQLAGIMAHAEATGAFEALFSSKVAGKHKQDICLEGVPGCPGVGIGTAVLVYPPADLDAVPDRQVTDIDGEKQLFYAALEAARQEIISLAERLESSLPTQEQALFDAYLKILDDTALGKEVCNEIDTGLWAQAALRKVIKKHIRQFEALEDPYLRERASDIRDLGRRVLAYLQERQAPILIYPEQTVLIGEEVTPSALAEVPEGYLVGIVSLRGSVNSHVAILARALGIPAVMGVDGLAISNQSIDGSDVIVDGYYGQVYLWPSPQLRQQFITLADEERELDTNLEELHGLPAVTPDGHPVALFVNTGLPADAGLSLSVGAEGVGLFRTEIPFMARDHFPAEEEQRIIYRQLLNAFAPRPVIMRTLDIGGDKSLPYFPVTEENPYLGWRGIRVTLDHPEVFLVQVRAMLKASNGLNNLRILLPMISSVKELDDALELLDQAYQEVIAEGTPVIRPPIGIMIEVPSAVYQIRDLAKRVDFVSVGTNDLTQYLLAVDRNNSRVSQLYDCLHPAVLNALLQIMQGVREVGKEISICGEMASDPAAVIVLLAMGFQVLSMSSVVLPRVKWIIRTLSYGRACELLKEVLEMDDAAHIRFHLDQALEQTGLGGLIRAGK